ncbi:MAG TPA: tail fiber domain-containing protein [Terriglobales bacterium]|nr:tail fiber domain-containing protein [Terriglobales bacterium]
MQLYSNTTGDHNTASGIYALFHNTTGSYNTANGVFALVANTTGFNNTADGAFALGANTIGEGNTATGAGALWDNTTGNDNTANGANALGSNTNGADNTAVGSLTLGVNTSGFWNTAVGFRALQTNRTGNENTALGSHALVGSFGNGGNGNTAVGFAALTANSGGSLNTALGHRAGQGLVGDESNNIDIGASVDGVAGESNTIRIGNTDITDTFISGASGTTVASGAAVLVDSNGHLGTVTSSKRFKDNIKPMDKASEVLLALKPVTFRYKKEIDPAGISQFGLVAEEVEKVNPDLVVRDQEGTPYTVRYDAVNAMLLNEFLKEHKKTEKLEATVASLIATVKEQAAQIQKVSTQFEASKMARVVFKDR